MYGKPKLSVKAMKTILINEHQFNLLKEGLEEEVTFHEFDMSLRSFINNLLTNPQKANVNSILKNRISREDLIDKIKSMGLIDFKEDVKEIFSNKDNKQHAHVTQKFSPNKKMDKSNFDAKVRKLYSEIIKESKSVFANENEIIDRIKEMDDDKAYWTRGGYKLTNEGEIIKETDCASVGAIGDGSDSSGQYTVPFGPPNRQASFYKDTLTRNKDEENGSISMNRQKKKK